jgi:hypothetical protein
MGTSTEEVVMAKYMITWDLPMENRDEAIARFVDGAALEEPEGITLLSRWHSVAGGRGWSVVETADPASIMDWLLHWSDLLSYEVEPVITDDEFGGLLGKHGHA